MMRIFLDANVLFSAASGRSPGFRRFWTMPGVTTVTSARAADEARRNLPQAGGAREELVRLLSKTEVATESAEPINGAGRSWDLPDPDDVPILLSAIHSRCGFFLTGDNHFKAMFGTRVEGVLVLIPSAFLSDHAPKDAGG